MPMFELDRFPVVRLARDRRGGVAVLAALSAPILAGFAALAVDIGHAYMVRTELQSTADAAALAASAKLPNRTAALAEARTIAAENLPPAKHGNVLADRDLLIGTWDPERRSFTSGGSSPNAVRVTLRRSTANGNPLPSFFGRVLGTDFFDIEARAVAGPSREPLCLMAMHPTRKHTFYITGPVRITAPDCHIYANSNHPDDVVDPKDRNAFVTAKSIQAIGYGHHYLQNLTPPLEYAPYLIPDPLATLALPPAGGCSASGLRLSGGNHTLSPGTYCGGLQIKSGANVTLRPGQYHVRGGALVVDQATLRGEDVVIFLSDNRAELDFTRATVQLSGRRAGPYAGLVIASVRDAMDHVFENSRLELEGVVYLLRGDVTWINQGTPANNARWTAMIVDGFTFDGSGELRINFQPHLSTVPYPNRLKVIPRNGFALLQ
ncbi:MAG: pilus assembly protein TadG-related protein [Geminicoccaceae bacterium]|nr:pilus assembly protein TadG-related protein [Geminicoccaceae bacterium]